MQTLQTMAQPCAALQQTVNTILEKEKRKGHADAEEDHSVRNFADKFNSDAGRETSDNMYSEHMNIGVSSKDVRHIDLVSAEIRKKILKGEDIILCSLLMPAYETSRKDQEKADKRLSRNLNISEFVTAFSRFKRIMFGTYPWRQQVLDMYLAHIIEVHNVWSTKFYEYHKLFSSKCAIALKQNQMIINWSKGDGEILKRVVAVAEVSKCNFCSSKTQTSSMCIDNQEDKGECNHHRGLQILWDYAAVPLHILAIT